MGAMDAFTKRRSGAVLGSRALVLAAVLALGAFALVAPGVPAQTPTPTATAAPPRTSELAPIEAVEVQALTSQPVQYYVQVTSGLPGGCAAFESITAQRTGTRIEVTVKNSMPVGPVPCTKIYGMVRNGVNIGSAFEAGVVYTVVVNGGGTRPVSKTFSTTTVPPLLDPGVTPPPATPPAGAPALPAPRPANTGTGGLASDARRGALGGLIGGSAAIAVALALIAARVTSRRGDERR